MSVRFAHYWIVMSDFDPGVDVLPFLCSLWK